MTEKEALIVLNLVDGVGSKTIQGIRERWGNVIEIFGKSEEVITQEFKIDLDLSRRILSAPSDLRSDLKRELEFIHQQNLSILTLWDPGYPLLLSQIYDPPVILYVKGKYDFQSTSLAIVGARTSTLYGNQTAYRLAYQLSTCGVAIVSGLARGIDTHAHRGAIASKGVTVGVMGCGFRYFYPTENKKLADQIIEKGALITEFPSEVPPLGQNFPKRNRIISGLSAGVVVVEAARKSGSLITANMALEQGRSVFAVPGRVDDPSAEGTLGLIKEGARLIQSVEDIFEELGLEVNSALQYPGDSNVQCLGTEEESLLKVMGSDPLSIDDLSRIAKMETSHTLSLLFAMELRHLVKQLPGKYYVKNIVVSPRGLSRRDCKGL